MTASRNKGHGRDASGTPTAAAPGAMGAGKSELEKGDICGDWTIERFVAEGGMGEVYEVRGVYGRKRGALKRIRAQHASRADFGERFDTEIRILAELDHPYIVGLLHAGMHEGSPYFVMEWLDGMTLRDMLNFRREPFSLAEALLHAICIADALCAAHGEGILHRDLKPENVFMLKKGGLKVLDFGLGKLAEGNRVSTSERLAGMCTVHYAAPEQLDRSTSVDDRTDVYALGHIFVEMVTLFWAFADTPGMLPPKEIARANQLFAKPKSLRAILPGCPESLADLIDAALSKDKEKRPRSTELLTGLRAERRALRAKAQAVASEPDEPDIADEPAPPAALPQALRESSLIRLIPQIRTETLPPEQPPGDPTAAGNPAPPIIRTIKMYAPREEDLEAARRSEAERARARDAAGDTTGHSRSATLPPEPTETPAPPAGSRSQSAKPAAQPTAPRGLVHKDQDDRGRESFSSRPTLPWRAQLRAPEGPRSLTPTHKLTVTSDVVRSPRVLFPIWAGPVLGIVLSLVAFAGLKLARERVQGAPGGPPSTAATANTAASAPAAPSATPPVEPNAPAAAEPSAPAPSAPPLTTATAATTATAPAARAPAGVPRSQTAKQKPKATVLPEPIFSRPKPEPPPTRNRVFGIED